MDFSIKTKIYTISFCTLIFIVSCFIFCDGVLIGDDIYFKFLAFGIKISKDFSYGSWLMDVQNILMYYIPHKLNINIQDWALTFGTYIKATIITSFSLIYLKIMQLKNIKNKIAFPCALLFVFLHIILLKKTWFIDFIIYEGFFRFTIPSLLLLIFLYQFYKFILQKSNNINFLSILGIITASSSEICAIISIISIFLYEIYAIFSNDTNKQKNYSITQILLSLIIGFIILINSDGFQGHFQDKLNNININPNINLGIFYEFAKLFFKKIILDYSIVHISFLTMFLFVLKSSKSKLEKFFPISIIISIFTFSFSLIFLGETSYSGNYWLVHKDFHTIFISLFLFCLAILLSIVLSAKNNKLNTKKIICYLITIGILLLPPLYSSISFIKKSNNNIKQHSYIRDKIRLFYLYKNQVPIMPYFSSFEAFFSLIKNHNIAFGDNIIIKKEIPTLHYERLEKHYFKTTYNVEIKPYTEEIKIVTDKQALYFFKENGGTIDEIYLKKYKFSDLKNWKFVLENKT